MIFDDRTATALTGSAGVSPAGLITLSMLQRFLVISHGRGFQRRAEGVTPHWFSVSWQS